MEDHARGNRPLEGVDRMGRQGEGHQRKGRDVDARVADLAERQHGVVTRAQLLGLGLSPAAVGRRLRGGRLRSLHRGVYLAAPAPYSASQEMAAVLAGGPQALLSHGSAAAAWELVEENAGPVEVMVPGESRRRRPGVRVHRTTGVQPDERAQWNGIPTTTPGRTVVDLAARVGSRELEGMLARGERQGLDVETEVKRLVERYRHRPGIGMLRALLGSRDRPVFTRSEAESRFLALLREAGLPKPQVNVSLGPYEIDFLWRGRGVAVEVDGFRFHSSRARFEGDRRKDAWLLARGIKVIRLSWRQLTDEGLATAVQVGQALGRADGR